MRFSGQATPSKCPRNRPERRGEKRKQNRGTMAEEDDDGMDNTKEKEEKSQKR